MVNFLMSRSATCANEHDTVDDKVTPIWNTMAVIPGHIRDEVVLIGNHRDGISIRSHYVPSIY